MPKLTTSEFDVERNVEAAEGFKQRVSPAAEERGSETSIGLTNGSRIPGARRGRVEEASLDAGLRFLGSVLRETGSAAGQAALDEGRAEDDGGLPAGLEEASGGQGQRNTAAVRAGTGTAGKMHDGANAPAGDRGAPERFTKLQSRLPVVQCRHQFLRREIVPF